MCIKLLLSSSFFQGYDKQSVDEEMRCLSQEPSTELFGFTGVPRVQLYRAGKWKGCRLGLTELAAAVLKFLNF